MVISQHISLLTPCTNENGLHLENIQFRLNSSTPAPPITSAKFNNPADDKCLFGKVGLKKQKYFLIALKVFVGLMVVCVIGVIMCLIYFLSEF